VLLASLRVGNTRRAACRAAEISDDTLRRWLKRDPALASAVESAEAEAEQRFVGQVAGAARDGSWQAAAWWLEHRRPEDWGRRYRADLIIDVEREAGRIALAAGLDVKQLLAAVERLLRDARRDQP
jgi:hypothetical protein